MAAQLRPKACEIVIEHGQRSPWLHSVTKPARLTQMLFCLRRVAAPPGKKGLQGSPLSGQIDDSPLGKLGPCQGLVQITAHLDEPSAE